MPVMLETINLEALARVGRALADDTRRRLLMELLAGSAYPSDLAEALGTTKANVSNHLACLRDCGLVRGTHQGRKVLYELADDRLASALTDLAGLVVSPYCPEEDR
ncbi:MAG: ArsR/SmtB family transcription factor [Microthrixaceae bacterium]